MTSNQHAAQFNGFLPQAAGIALSATGICRHFGATQALDQMELQVLPGEVHGLVGANGAGKSTLVKILSGALKPDSGTITVGGWHGESLTPRRVQQLGLATIFQERSLAPNLTVVENIVLGRERTIAGLFLTPDHQQHDVEDVLRRVGLNVSPMTPLSQLSPAAQQLVEIAKALYRGARLIIMDEPTAVLGAAETTRLLELVRDLSSKGVAVVYISHHLHETLALSDRVTVMREGRAVLTAPSNSMTPQTLVEAMIGRHVALARPTQLKLGDVVFSARALGQGRRLFGINLDLRAGEIVGLTGLVGSGRSRLARVIFGAEQPDSGEMFLFGKPYHPASPAEAITLGVGLVPEDRKTESLLQQMTVAQNVTLTRMPATPYCGFIRLGEEQRTAMAWVKRLKIRSALPGFPVSTLSGGNQQKVAIARWLHTKARLMIFDEPGQGVDIGAKEEILQTIGALAGDDCAVLVISSDLEELTQVANRVLVLRQGRIAGELTGAEVTEQRVLELAMGTTLPVSMDEPVA
ncbi:sugar ABC transporter ATP-binding protein [Mesorhizobium newzealandense]|uniref:Sugar ABC transporter ATP-binding protein n=2 Tax=Mesorhizobium TaxID=68287 RepID=A0ABW4U5T3_9HYPH